MNNFPEFFGKNELNLVCSTDDNFISHAYAMMNSVRLNTKSKVNFYVLTKGINHENQRVLESLISKNFKVNFILVEDKFFNSFKKKFHIAEASYYRLLMAWLLPEEIDKCIFLDCDMIVRGDLSELYKIPIENFSICAVPESHKNLKYVSSDWALKNYKTLKIPENNKMFNAGLLYVNLEKWRNTNITPKLLDYAYKNQEILKFCDQDVLNAIFWNDWKQLSYSWNFTTSCLFNDLENSPFKNLKELKEAKRRANIFHFTSGYKPWHKDGHDFSLEYYKYTKGTLVSIVIRTKNRLDDLKKCLESLKSQTHKQLEIIVVDDASTDGTSEFLKNNILFKHIRVKKRKSTAQLYNVGWKNSMGEIVVYTDDDCVADKNWIENILDEFNSDSELMVVGGLSFIGDTEDIYFRGAVSGCNMAFRKKIFNKYHFDANLKYSHLGDESELISRLKRNNVKIKFSEKSVVKHYIKPGKHRIDQSIGSKLNNLYSILKFNGLINYYYNLFKQIYFLNKEKDLNYEKDEVIENCSVSIFSHTTGNIDAINTTLNSLMYQDYSNYELFIANQGEKIPDSYSKIKLIQSNKISELLNFFLHQSNGQLVVFAKAGYVYEKKWLRSLIDNIKGGNYAVNGSEFSYPVEFSFLMKKSLFKNYRFLNISNDFNFYVNLIKKKIIFNGIEINKLGVNYFNKKIDDNNNKSIKGDFLTYNLVGAIYGCRLLKWKVPYFDLLFYIPLKSKLKFIEEKFRLIF
ncbi:glycosyltransferase [Candidatus Woesearchaeota archaeon]|nr:glycosyltransferase [Candidatus Woesearchaeota archaeon]